MFALYAHPYCLPYVNDATGVPWISFTYVVLCSIKFDKKILSNINLNQNINSTVSKIERNFIKKYSKIYDLIMLYE